MTTYSLIDASGLTRFVGTIAPSPVELTVSAADIASVWDDGKGGAAIEWADFPTLPQTVLLTYQVANTLDQGAVFRGLGFYTPAASTADVFDNGESMSAAAVTPGTYSVVVTQPVPGAATALLPGSAAYLKMQADALPTTGALTVAILTGF